MINEFNEKSLDFFQDYLNGKVNEDLAHKIIALEGVSGSGKTFAAKQLIKKIKTKVFYLSHEKIKGTKLKDLNNIKVIENSLIFIDNLQSYIKYDSNIDITPEANLAILNLLSKVKETKRAGLLITSDSLGIFDYEITKRIELIFQLNPPNSEAKLKFLKEKFGKHLNKNFIETISKNSIGYNIPDIENVVKSAYRIGKGKFSEESIKTALKGYTPSEFLEYNTLKCIDLNFSNIIGKEDVKEKLKNFIFCLKNKEAIKKLGLKRPNLLIFTGNPGVGKTYMAKALAGELNYPLISLNAKKMYSRSNPLEVMERSSNFIERFRECIVLIDEVDKLLGRGVFGEDGVQQGMMNDFFDGTNNIPDDVVIILIANQASGLGEGVLDRFNVIEFDYPSDNDRKEFFKIKLENTKKIFNANFSISKLSRVTNGMSYRNMEKLWNEIIYLRLKNKAQLSFKDIEKVAEPFQISKSYAQLYG